MQFASRFFNLVDGKSKIVSYINNLDRKKNSELYDTFARGFDSVG